MVWVQGFRAGRGNGANGALGRGRVSALSSVLWAFLSALSLSEPFCTCVWRLQQTFGTPHLVAPPPWVEVEGSDGLSLDAAGAEEKGR
jgi:hypothetical protein